MTDESGYYNVKIGTEIGAADHKYRILDKLGKGVFGVVIRALPSGQQNSEVAIKVLRKN